MRMPESRRTPQDSMPVRSPSHGVCGSSSPSLCARAALTRPNTSVAASALASGGCPWKFHLYDLERALGVDPRIAFVLYEDSSGMWRVQAVTEEGTAFTNRVGLRESWRGLRDAALDAATGIPGGKFVHAAGFIGGHATYDGAKALALATLAAL